MKLTENDNALFRVPQQPSTKDKFKQLHTEVQNLTMASRISQMMVQRLLQNDQNIGNDISKLFQLVTELQYKVLALQQYSSIDAVKLAEISNELRLRDFTEASDKEDQALHFSVVDTVEDDSTIIITSRTEVEDQGIFRSRIKLADTGSPELIQGLLGKTVGTKLTVKLNGVDHEIELLGIRRPFRDEKPADTTTNV